MLKTQLSAQGRQHSSLQVGPHGAGARLTKKIEFRDVRSGAKVNEKLRPHEKVDREERLRELDDMGRALSQPQGAGVSVH